MNKFKHFLMMGCLLYLATFSQANNTTFTTTDGTPIEVIEKTHHGSPERASGIYASHDGHALMVIFTENIGQVDVEIATASGNPVDFTSIQSPNGMQCYIPNTGDYIVTFTLPNGDEYYGEFSVTE